MKHINLPFFIFPFTCYFIFTLPSTKAFYQFASLVKSLSTLACVGRHVSHVSDIARIA